MSRRAPAPDRSEQNRATLKQLVKLEANKSCADCKRNKHPRWASWNIGVFVCIRCSGIHRSLGVHISRVKSVDLDSWTEEQMASMLKWGNARANKYWEAKLAAGHVPNEAKIENFIRTKYESKRWVMDGPMPDPSTLDEEGADDDVPLNVVQEKARITQNAGQRNGSGGIARPPAVDLFGDVAAPARPSTTEPAARAPPRAPAAPARQSRPQESLLGLDFLGGTQSAPPRPASAASGLSQASGRTDLKNSILSLYASTPKPAAQPATQPAQADPFGSMQSAQPQSNAASLSGLGDAFGGLSFSSNTSVPQNKAPAFTGITSTSSNLPSQPKQSALSGGSFFDTKPAQQSKPAAPTSKPAPVADFSAFKSTPTATPSSNAMGDLFDLSAPEPTPAPVKASHPPPISASNYTAAAAFNLSSQPKSQPAPVQAQSQASFPAMNNMDAWGSSDAWATPEPSTPAPAPAPAQTATTSFKAPVAEPVVSNSNGGWADNGGWGEPEPTPAKPATSAPAPSSTSAAGFSVQQDEEFGGWSHASPVATSGSAKPPGVGGSDDLFGNVWG